jgi:photosystem II stability/assembly factor-like uncharacterized protein
MIQLHLAGRRLQAMLRRSRHIPALAVAACGLLAAACSAPAGTAPASTSQRSLPALPPWQLTQVTSLDAVSGEVAYAIGGQDLLARTGDGGRHWTELRPAPAPTGLLDVLGPATALGAQDAGDAGAILRSADGGHTWRHSSTTLVAPPGAGYTPLLDFSDASHGWLVYGGVTWRTSDGGINWT